MGNCNREKELRALIALGNSMVLASWLHSHSDDLLKEKIFIGEHKMAYDIFGVPNSFMFDRRIVESGADWGALIELALEGFEGLEWSHGASCEIEIPRGPFNARAIISASTDQGILDEIWVVAL